VLGFVPSYFDLLAVLIRSEDLDHVVELSRALHSVDDFEPVSQSLLQNPEVVFPCGLTVVAFPLPLIFVEQLRRHHPRF
jgi:hypothetical protein